MKMRVEMGGPIEAEELFCVGPDGRCYPYRTVLIVGRALESTDGGVIDAEVMPAKKPNSRIASSDLTDFAKAVEQPKRQATPGAADFDRGVEPDPEAEFAHEEPDEFTGELFDNSPNTGA